METQVHGRTMEVSVLVHGIRQPIYFRQRDNQAFVEGLWGQPFVLEVRNLTHERVEILNSVDGRNSLKEEEGDLRTNRGMVVGPLGVWKITGWRIDDNNTAQFVFTDPSQSVEHKVSGQNKNKGVFGFALFHEYYPEPAFRGGGDVMRGGPQIFGGAKGGPESFEADMGTGIGAVQADSVGHTTFRRSNLAPDVLTVQYRSREWLQRYGIIVPDEPKAFPGSQTGYGSLIR